ncbi:trafficking protein particle complex subunit 13 [Oryctolagus cuniculus]|uniref:trafficking protein particle complex subunit 13 n=1 Tax=Oryctolagus cuniculus TaxID=9986 RepID=UPI00049136D4|nr:trafficking protein particle complex subunit 13 [Oryctolagus cuniculus]
MFLKNRWLFPFLPPLEVRTVFHNLDKNELLVEIHIQNISLSEVFVEKVSLVLPEIFSGMDVGTYNLDEEYERTSGEITFLQPMDECRYFCLLQLKSGFLEDSDAIRRLTRLGKLNVFWKKNLHETAIQQTIQLERDVPHYRSISVSVESMPDKVIVEEPFYMTCKITNFSDQKMKLFLNLCNTDAVHWHLRGGKYLGKLPPRTSLCLPLNLLFVKQGLQRISGIQLTDKYTKKTYYCDDILTVCVIPDFRKISN